jgi:hypothetical protein
MAARRVISAPGLDTSRVERLVVVPNFQFGCRAEEMGLIDDDEAWTPTGALDRIRGWRFTAWRYLDTLEQAPPPGSSQDVLEEWLGRPSESPFPPLDRAKQVQLDAMVMFAAP